jgi:hypothetical protein
MINATQLKCFTIVDEKRSLLEKEFQNKFILSMLTYTRPDPPDNLLSFGGQKKHS